MADNTKQELGLENEAAPLPRRGKCFECAYYSADGGEKGLPMCKRGGCGYVLIATPWKSRPRPVAADPAQPLLFGGARAMRKPRRKGGSVSYGED